MSIISLISILAAIVSLIAITAVVTKVMPAPNLHSSGKKTSVIISLLSIFVVAVSWITNIGWMRIMLSFFLVPFLHAIYYFILNLAICFFVGQSKSLRLMNLLFSITYVLSNLFFPDGGDAGPSYFFFGLVKNDVLSDIAYVICVVSFVLHIILIALQLISVFRLKKQRIQTEVTDELLK